MKHLIAFDQGWQRPARTEEWAFERCRDGLAASPFFQYVGFPWATLIDLEDRGRHEEAAAYRNALSALPPRMTLVRATVCQHIWMPRLIQEFLRLKITDIFWPHARIGEEGIEGIRLHPFPLYPVQALDHPAAPTHGPRDLLYSFAGAYDSSGYLTPARAWLLELPARADAVMISRSAWHFETDVYGAGGGRSDAEGIKARAADEYRRLLTRSVFSLCPSGSGPNTIRLWESLGLGAIPVVLSDTLRLPGDGDLWEKAILRVPETRGAISALPARLERLARDESALAGMRAAGREIWRSCVETGPERLIAKMADPSVAAGAGH